METRFSSIVATNRFSPWDLIDDAFQGVTHEQVHMEDTSMSHYGNKCSLKEESNVFPFDIHLDSLAEGT